MNNKIKRSGIWVMMTLIASGLTFGCLEESDFEKLRKESDRQIADYLETHDINTVESAQGIHYEILVENEDGDIPSPGEVLAVKYEMRTLDGALVGAQLEDSVLFQFGSGNIVPYGMNYGMDIAKKGEKVRFYLPTYYAYDAYHPQNHSFDAYDNFIVEMELVDIFTESEINAIEITAIENYIEENEITDIVPSASGLYFKTTIQGTGETANSYNSVRLHYVRKYLDGTVIQQTSANAPLFVHLNTGELVEGFGQGILKMKAGESALMIMPSSLAFGSSVQVFPGTLRAELFANGLISNLVAPYSPVIYEVQLLEID